MNEVILAELKWGRAPYLGYDSIVLPPDANNFVWRIPVSALDGLDDIPLEDLPLALASVCLFKGYAQWFWVESTVPCLSKRLELGI